MLLREEVELNYGSDVAALCSPPSYHMFRWDATAEIVCHGCLLEALQVGN